MATSQSGEYLCPGTVGLHRQNGQHGHIGLMVKGSILEVEFILISRGKKLN